MNLTSPVEHLFITSYKQGSDNYFEYSFDRIMFPWWFISGDRIHTFSLQIATMPSGKHRTSLHSRQLGVRLTTPSSTLSNTRIRKLLNTFFKN